MNMVTLKTGTDLPEDIVVVGMLSLKTLIAKEPIAFCELVAVCRDRNHQLFGNTAEILRGFALVGDDGQPNNSMRDIVLAAVEGDGFGMKLGSPLPPPNC